MNNVLEYWKWTDHLYKTWKIIKSKNKRKSIQVFSLTTHLENLLLLCAWQTPFISYLVHNLIFASNQALKIIFDRARMLINHPKPSSLESEKEKIYMLDILFLMLFVLGFTSSRDSPLESNFWLSFFSLSLLDHLWISCRTLSSLISFLWFNLIHF